MDIIAANTKIMNDRLDILTKELTTNSEKIKTLEKDCKEFVKSLDATEEIHNKKIDKMQEKIENIQEKVNDDSEIIKIKNKLREMEDRSRRNNLRIDGIKEGTKESWEQTEKKVQDIFMNKLNLHNVKIERAHRTGKDADDEIDIEMNEKRPRTIILKLLDFKDKTEILRNARRLQGTGIFINEDFCYETTIIRKDLRKK